jgi:serine/threonine protein kinase
MAENLKSETNKLITGEKSSQTNVSSVIRIWDKFSVIQEIASGGYGKVFSVQNNFDKSKYSVKIINLKTFGYEEIALKEIELLAKLESEYIVHYKSSWIEFDIKRTLLYIQTELCDRNLKDFLNDINSDIKLKNQNILTLLGYYICSEITEEIFEGINYLHKQNISHLFLNPTNILLKNVLIGKVIRIKVFTSAAKQELIKQNILEETCEYIAPEVFDNDFNETKADIFSLGIILEELFSIDLKRYSILIFLKIKAVFNLFTTISEFYSYF